MAANFGIGIGAFADGFVRGVSLGEKLKKVRNENEEEAQRKQALEEAKKEREAAIEAETQRLLGQDSGAQAAPVALGAEQPAPQAAPEVPVATPQPVRIQNPAARGLTAPVPPAPATTPAAATAPATTPAAAPVAEPAAAPAPAAAAPAATPAAAGLPRLTEKEARKLAEEKVGADGYKFIATRMRDLYLQRGDVEKAEAWDKYAETKAAQRQMAQFGKALQSAAVGNHDGFLKNITPILEDNYGAGFKIRKTEPVKDKDGNITGYNFEILNTRTGEATQNNLGLDELYQVGLTMGSPQQGFERWLGRMQEREKANAQAAAEVGKIRAETEKELVKARTQAERDRILQDYKIELEREKARLNSDKDSREMQQKLKTATTILKEAGYGDEFIKAAVPEIIGANPYRRGTSPDEFRTIAWRSLSNDPMFNRQSPEKQRESIDKAVAVLMAAHGQVNPTAAAPAPAAAPAASAPSPAPAREYRKDPVTGQVYLIDNGRRIPLNIQAQQGIGPPPTR